MKVEQEIVSVRHFVFSQRAGQNCLVKNYVVLDHDLRSHMLRMLVRKFDDLYSDSDRWAVLGLAHTYLEQTEKLLARTSWKNAIESQLLDPDRYSYEIRASLQELLELIQNR